MLVYCPRKAVINDWTRHDTTTLLSLYSNGSEWWRLRSSLQKNISKPVYIRQFITSTNDILGEFVEALGKSATEPVDIERYLGQLNLERELRFTCDWAIKVALLAFYSLQ